MKKENGSKGRFPSFMKRDDSTKKDDSTKHEPSDAALNAVQNTDPMNDPATAPTVSSDAEPEQEGVAPRGPSESAMVPQTELDAAVQERDELRDKLARQQAEFANATRRQAKERAELRDLIAGATVEPFLPVLDNFHLALKAKSTPEQFRAGVELIARQLEDALKGLGIVPLETAGVAFDPHVHEALGQVETNDVPDHHVVDELRRGYKLKERLLRPAQVRVAVNQEQAADVN